jgi:hypothetical protein
MAASKTDTDKYRKDPNEKNVDFGNWEQAVTFWNKLLDRDSSLSPIFTVFGDLKDSGGGTMAERTVVLIKAWNLWISGKKLTIEQITPEYEQTEAGDFVLVDKPILGGIDIPKERKTKEKLPTPEEIEAQKEAIKKANLAEMQKTVETKKTSPAPKPKPKG